MIVELHFENRIKPTRIKIGSEFLYLVGSFLIVLGIIYFGYSHGWVATKIIGMIAGAISLIAFLPYIQSILNGETKPNVVTWFIWSLVGFLVESSYFSSGARDTNYVALVYMTAPFIVFLLSIRYGKGKLTLFDMVALFLSLLGIVLWFKSDSPFIGLILFLTADLFASLPTVRDTYKNPEYEDSFAWFLTLSASVINIYAIDKWDVSIYVYPFYATLVYSIVFFLSLRKVNNSIGNVKSG